MNKFKKLQNVKYGACALLILLGVSACGDDAYETKQEPQGTGNGGANKSVSGAIQKGPFIIGSSITVSLLDDNGNPTDRNIETRVTNSVGEFSFTASEEGVYQITGDGYFFNELTGNLSSDKLTLNAVYEITSEKTQRAYVNMLTHLINERVIYLLKIEGATVGDAIAQAEADLVRELYNVLPIDGHAKFTGLSVYNTEGADAEWNTYLLALSVGMYKYAEVLAGENKSEVGAELESLLNTLAKDLESDGVLQSGGFIEGFKAAMREINPDVVIEHLQSRSSIDFDSPLDVPDISKYLGICAGVEECPWREGDKLPVQIHLQASVNYQDKIYLFGGWAKTSDSYTANRAYAYAPSTGESIRLAESPLHYRNAKAHAINGKIYLVDAWGVEGYDNRIQVYDPLNDSWELKSSIPTYRIAATSVAVGNKIYVIGGNATQDGGPISPTNPYGVRSGVVEIYDVETELWTQGMPYSGILSLKSCEYKNKIYNVSGTRTYVYDIATDSWSRVADREHHPNRGSEEGCVVIGEDLYLFGGETPYKYNIPNNQWSAIMQMPAPRSGFSMTAVGADIYLMGGSRRFAGEVRVEDRVDIFDTQVEPNPIN